MIEISAGTEIYYDGDRANEPGFGKVVTVQVSGSVTLYRVEMDDGRKFAIGPAHFTPGPGQRFYRKADYLADRQRRIDAMNKQFESMLKKDR